MDVITLEAQTRATGKGPARAARRAGEVPCVLYGHNVEPVIFMVPEPSLKPLIYTTEMHRVEVNLGKKSFDCIVKHIDFHPVSDRPMHVDFQVLKKGEAITLTVPLLYSGAPIGQRDGGRVQAVSHEIAITCLPKDLPNHVEIDVSNVKIGDSIHVRDLEVPGLTFVAAPDTLLYSILAARIDLPEPGELVEEAGEAEEEEE